MERAKAVRFNGPTLIHGYDGASDESGYSIQKKYLSQHEVNVFEALQYLDKLNDNDVMSCVNRFALDGIQMELENEAFIEFIRLSDSQFFNKISELRWKIAELQEVFPIRVKLPSMPLQPVGALMNQANGPNRINVATRNDILSRISEDISKRLVTLMNKTKTTIDKLQATIEECSIAIEETDDIREKFEEVMKAATDPQSKTIAGEKYIRFLEEWRKRANQIMDNFRLRNSSMLPKYRKMKNYEQEKIHEDITYSEVDYLLYLTENERLLTKIKSKASIIIDLKTDLGRENYALAAGKRSLVQLMDIEKNLVNKISNCGRCISNLHLECKRTEEELEEAKRENQHVKHLINNYRVPDVQDYLRVKIRLDELMKKQKFLDNKEYLQNIEMNTTIHKMMDITKCKTVKNEWFEKPPKKSCASCLSEPDVTCDIFTVIKG